MAEEEKKTEEVIVEPKVIKHETLVEALAYAQLEYEPLEKTEKVDFETKQGGRVKYSYAGLPSTRRVTDPHLNKHGLVVTDKTEIREGREYLVSTLRHAFSEAIDKTELEITESGGDMKDLGGNITYARRYNYCNLTGRIAEDDNDARDVQKRKQPEPEQSKDKKEKPPSNPARTAFFALLTEEEVFEDDDERHKWQAIAFPKKPSTTKWAKADFVKGKALIMWRLEVGIESDELLSYTTTKASSKKGLVKQFLAVMGAAKLTDVRDIGNWAIGMASAALSVDHQLEVALDMGKAVMRANATKGLFDKIKEVMGVTKMSSMSKEQVIAWEVSFRSAVEQFQTEHSDIDLDVELLVKGVEEKV